MSVTRAASGQNPAQFDTILELKLHFRDATATTAGDRREHPDPDAADLSGPRDLYPRDR